MSVEKIMVLLGILFWTLCPSPIAHAQTNATSLPTLIQNSLTMARDGVLILEEDEVHQFNEVQTFYVNRGYRPVWLVGRYVPERTKSFLQCIEQTKNHGLLPADYHYEAIDKLINVVGADVTANASEEQIIVADEQLVALELLLSDAYLLIAQHLTEGKAKRDTARYNWYSEGRRTLNYAQHFTNTVSTNGDDLCASLEQLAPKHKEYQQLKEILATYRQLDWKPIAYSQNILLQKGQSDAALIPIKQVLQTLGDLPPSVPTAYFDEALQRAVMDFQERHGLHRDGLVRRNVMWLINRTADYRIKQIVSNLERYRWLPDDLGEAYVEINIAAYLMKMVERNQTVYNAPVIVGKPFYPTPAFRDSISYLVLNPYWVMPRSIAKNELLYEVQEDSTYIERNNIEVLQGRQIIDPTFLDWNTINTDHYVFRQKRHEENPMGVVKFIFPNEHQVYLHDTPEKEIFGYSVRSKSHGCVRLKDPLQFAEYVLHRDDPSWNATKMEQIMAFDDEQKIVLQKPLPIYLFYWTVFKDEDNVLNFREDIYSRDEDLYQILNTRL